MSERKQAGAPEPERWQAAQEAEGRGRLTDLRQHLYGAATQQMLEAAKLQPGDLVLDTAAGTGDQSRQAVRLVRPGGSVLVTDISQETLDVAARLAQQEGLNNLTTRAMNAEQLDLPQNRYDAVISRLGLMLIKRMQQALTSAGFQEVQVQAIALTFQFPFFETLTAWWGPPFEKALAKLEPEPGQCMLEEVRQAVRHLRDRRGSWHQQNCCWS